MYGFIFVCSIELCSFFKVVVNVHFSSPSEGGLCGSWNSTSLSAVPGGCLVNEPHSERHTGPCVGLGGGTE